MGSGEVGAEDSFGDQVGDGVQFRLEGIAADFRAGTDRQGDVGTAVKAAMRQT